VAVMVVMVWYSSPRGAGTATLSLWSSRAPMDFPHPSAKTKVGCMNPKWKSTLRGKRSRFWVITPGHYGRA
jgi:hypothetical protein